MLPFAPVASFILPLSAQSWEYGSVTWHPLNTTLTNRLEACQRFAARVILQSWNLSHEDLLQKSNLPLLSKRRDYATLCHLYKILHHLSSSPNPYNPYPRPSLRNLNSRAIVPPFCRLTLCQKSFYPYAPTLWNYLPEDIIQCSSLQSFKVSPPFLSWLASSIVCFGVCFFLCFCFYFPNYFFCFVVFGLPLFYCFCNIGLCQALGPNGINK